jgi:hypothetical protein
MPKVWLMLSPNNVTPALVLEVVWSYMVMAHHVTFTEPASALYQKRNVLIGGLEMIKRLLYPLGNLVRRVIRRLMRLLRDVLFAVLLIAATALGGATYRLFQINMHDISKWELGVTVAAIPVSLALICVLAKIIILIDGKDNDERDAKLVKTTAEAIATAITTTTQEQTKAIVAALGQLEPKGRDEEY